MSVDYYPKAGVTGVVKNISGVTVTDNTEVILDERHGAYASGETVTLYTENLELVQETKMTDSTFYYTDFFYPSSVVIDYVHYNSDTKEARISFHNGDAWTYTNVDNSIYTDWSNSTSAGRYYNVYVKGGDSYPSQPGTFAQQKVPVQVGKTFSVTVSLSGTATLQVEATDVLHAVAEAQAVAGNTVGIIVTVTGVVQN